MRIALNQLISGWQVALTVVTLGFYQNQAGQGHGQLHDNNFQVGHGKQHSRHSVSSNWPCSIVNCAVEVGGPAKALFCSVIENMYF